MKSIYSKITFLGFLLVGLLAFNVSAQTIGDFRTAPDQTGRHWTGNGTNFAAWERWNGTTWVSQPNTPTPQGGVAMTVTSGTFVTINAGVTVGVPTGYQLIIEDGGGIIFAASNSTLILSNDLTFDNTLGLANGSITGNGKVAILDPIDHNISGNGIISNLDVNTAALTNEVNLGLGDNLQITGVLNIVSGTLNTNDALTLKSSATRTASLAPISAGVITGMVNVERYFQNHRGWRLVTAPVTNITGTIYSNWQNSDKAPGVELWGVNTNDTTHGLKASGAFNLRRYTNGAYSNVTTTKVPMGDNEAFAMMVTGPWNSGLIGTGSAATSISTTGNLVTGTKNVQFSAANQWGLIGNPYASAVDFDEVYNNTPAEINRYFWSIDPNVGPYGYYVVVSYNGSSYDVTPSGAGSTAQNQMIQSGQAIFVKALNPGTATVQFQENDKSTTAVDNSIAVMRTNNNGIENMRINLYSATGSAPILTDGTLLNFHQTMYTNSFVDGEDIEKFSNASENLYIWNGTKKVIVEGRKLAEDGDEILVGMGNMKQQDYTLEIQPINMSSNGMTATLIDNYLNTQQTISLSSVTNYNFVVTADPASSSAHRFKIVFGNATTTSVTSVAKAETSVNAYPNPVLGESVKLEVTNLEKGTYTISVYSTLGQLMTSQTLNHNGGTANETVNLSTLAPGSYDVKVSNTNGSFETHNKIIKL